jgi:hypothetical protein
MTAKQKLIDAFEEWNGNPSPLLGQGVVDDLIWTLSMDKDLLRTLREAVVELKRETRDRPEATN